MKKTQQLRSFCRRLSKDARLAIGLILIVAVVLRLTARLLRGEASFWSEGYRFYYFYALSLLKGTGMCLEEGLWPGNLPLGQMCAFYPPVYPSSLALAMFAGGTNYFLSIAVMQSLIGAGTVFCTFLLGSKMFNVPSGLLAGLIVAIYPYYVWHDTALQENSILTFITVLATLLVYRSVYTGGSLAAAMAGVSLGLAVLTKATLASFVLLALPCMAMFGSHPIGTRLKQVSVILFTCVLTLSPWLIRNYNLLGSPVITSIAGRQLWLTNNIFVYDHYPKNTIDLDFAEAEAGLLASDEWPQLEALTGNELAQQRWFMEKGFDYIIHNPVITMKRAILKVMTAFSWEFSPVKQGFFQAAYFLSYAPILILGIIGVLSSRELWRQHLTIYMLFSGFIAVTSVFHAHTSHRTYLDVYLIIFAANTTVSTCSRWASHSSSDI